MAERVDGRWAAGADGCVLGVEVGEAAVGLRSTAAGADGWVTADGVAALQPVKANIPMPAVTSILVCTRPPAHADSARHDCRTLGTLREGFVKSTRLVMTLRALPEGRTRRSGRVRRQGLEPRTRGLRVRCSAN